MVVFGLMFALFVLLFCCVSSCFIALRFVSFRFELLGYGVFVVMVLLCVTVLWCLLCVLVLFCCVIVWCVLCVVLFCFDLWLLCLVDVCYVVFVVC